MHTCLGCLASLTASTAAAFLFGLTDTLSLWAADAQRCLPQCTCWHWAALPPIEPNRGQVQLIDDSAACLRTLDPHQTLPAVKLSDTLGPCAADAQLRHPRGEASDPGHLAAHGEAAQAGQVQAHRHQQLQLQEGAPLGSRPLCPWLKLRAACCSAASNEWAAPTRRAVEAEPPLASLAADPAIDYPSPSQLAAAACWPYQQPTASSRTSQQGQPSRAAALCSRPVLSGTWWHADPRPAQLCRGQAAHAASRDPPLCAPLLLP